MKHSPLNFRLLGSGHPLIILHGQFGSLNNWITVGRDLSADFAVYLADQRNHGHSFHSDDHSYGLMAGDLQEFVKSLELDRVFVLGHSMGGKIAMTFALRYPELIDKLIVADIAPRPYGSGRDRITEALSSLDLSTIASRREAEDRLAPDIPDLRVRQFLLTNLRRSSDGGFEWKMNLKALRRNQAEMTKGVPGEGPSLVPALFIRGDRSDYIDRGDMAHIRRLFPSATFATVTGSGHWVHADAPDQFVSLVRGFLL